MIEKEEKEGKQQVGSVDTYSSLPLFFRTARI